MKIRKILAAITSIALVGTMLAGCGDNNNSSSGSGSNAGDNSGSNAGDNSGDANVVNDEKDVKLTVWGNTDIQDLLKEMCEAFAAANPDLNCTFNYEVISEADASASIVTDATTAADVFAFSIDQFKQLTDVNALYPVLNQSTINGRIPESAASQVSKDGTLYAYPWVTENLVMYYDKSKFTEEEVKSIESMVAKDLDDGVTNFIFDFDNGWYLEAFFLAAGCTVFGEDGTDATQFDWNSERGVLVGNYLYDLANSSKVSGANDGAADDSVIKSMFTEGTLGAAVSGPWNAKDLTEILGDNLGVAKLPTFELDGQTLQLQHFQNIKTIGVNTNTQFPKTAHALAEWLTNAENSLKVAQFYGSYNPVNTEVDTSSLSDNPTMIASIEQGQYGVAAPSTSQNDPYYTAATSFGQSLTNGDTTKDNMKDQLDKFVSSVLTTL